MNTTPPISVPPSTTNTEPRLAIIYRYDLPTNSDGDTRDDSGHATESIVLGYEASDALKQDAIGKERYYMPPAIAGLHRDLELPSAVALIASDLLFSDCSTLHDGAVGSTGVGGEHEHDRSSSPGPSQAQAQALDEATRQKRKTAVLHAIARGLQAMSGSNTALDIKELSTASLPNSEGSKDSIMYASIPAYYNPGDTAGPYTNSGASRSNYAWGRSSGPLKTLVGHTIDCLRKGVLPTDTDTDTDGTTDATGNGNTTMVMTEDQKRAVDAYQTTFDRLLSTPGRQNGWMAGRDDVIYQTALPIVLASTSGVMDSDSDSDSISVPVLQELIDRLNTELAQSKGKREAGGAARGARPRPGGPNGAGVKSFS